MLFLWLFWWVFPSCCLNLNPTPYSLSKLLKLLKSLVAIAINIVPPPSTGDGCKEKDNVHTAPMAVVGTAEVFICGSCCSCYDCGITSPTWFHHACSFMDQLYPTLVSNCWRRIAVHSDPSDLGSAPLLEISAASRCLNSNGEIKTCKVMVTRQSQASVVMGVWLKCCRTLEKEVVNCAWSNCEARFH